MATAESTNHLLMVAAKLLDQAAAEIRDAKLEPVHVNIGRIGKALLEIFELQEAICKLAPELKLACLSTPNEHPESNRLLMQYMVHASELERAGRIDSAIAAYEEYIALESVAAYRNIAENEIKKLRNAANDQANN